MSNPHARIIVESLEELEQIAQELRDSNMALSFQFNRLTEYSERLEYIRSRLQNVHNSLDLNDELKADIYTNYLDEIERIGVLIQEIAELITKRDWVRRMARAVPLIAQIVRGLIEIGQQSLGILEAMNHGHSELAAHIQSSLDYMQEHLQQHLLTG